MATTLLTYEEAAQRLGCSISHIRRMVRAAILPSCYIGKKTPCIPDNAVEDLIQSLLGEQGAGCPLLLVPIHPLTRLRPGNQAVPRPARRYADSAFARLRSGGRPLGPCNIISIRRPQRARQWLPAKIT